MWLQPEPDQSIKVIQRIWRGPRGSVSDGKKQKLKPWIDLTVSLRIQWTEWYPVLCGHSRKWAQTALWANKVWYEENGFLPFSGHEWLMSNTLQKLTGCEARRYLQFISAWNVWPSKSSHGFLPQWVSKQKPKRDISQLSESHEMMGFLYAVTAPGFASLYLYVFIKPVEDH